MERKEVLICGHRAFAASGLEKFIKKNNISFDCFSRGECRREKNIVTGDVMKMSENKHLETYNTVINFIILKGKSIEENLQYIQELLRFCADRKVKNLIHISSISVYPNNADYVNEDSPIENNLNEKGNYAALKVAIDQFLINSHHDELQISFVRPGFIYEKGHTLSKAGLFYSLLGINILLGNKKTSLPIIKKEKLHKALLSIIESKQKRGVYLVLDKNKNKGTKYEFVRNQWNINPIRLPKWLIMPCSNLLRLIRVINEDKLKKIEGLFKNTWFDSSKTENELQVSFDKTHFVILGAGTYGSYIANLLTESYPHEEITIVDVGDDNLKTEEEIGFLSHIIGAPYEALQKARFFGYGGASAKWGGQLLTFEDNDFENPTGFLKDIVELNKKYKNTVLGRFGLKNDEQVTPVAEKLFCKTGIWLSYFHRNLFKYFKIKKNRKINIINKTRVSKIIAKGNHISGIEIIDNNKLKHIITFDHYFLTCGAFESSRLLLHSGLINNKNSITFSDHLSQRAFHVTSGLVMGGQDFTFKIKGASLITKRLIGEVDGYSFYSQPICNENFPFFQDLKKLLFGHHFSIKLIGSILKNIPHCIAFAWYILVKKRLYVYKNEFILQIDVEAPKESGNILLCEEKDNFGERSLDVDLKILEKTGIIFTKARNIVKKFLDVNKISYTELPFSTTAEKYEDVYHPYGMFSDFDSVEEYFNRYDNLFVANTGVLPRAGGINSTCAVFPLIEEYISRMD